MKKMQGLQKLASGGFAALLALGLASGAHASDVAGQVSLPRRGAARDAVIMLEGGPKSSPLAKAMVDQRDKAFVPHVTVVTQGTTVEFPNNDTVFHNVFAYFNAKKFDLGVYPRGASKRQTFDKPGVVALLCNVHSEMSAYIVVVDTPYTAITDSRGHFLLRGVPPGTYTLHVWHESGAQLTQSYTVPPGASEVVLTLARK